MTREEAIYCMTTYLPNSDHSIYDCPKCKYYRSGCKSSEAHKLAIKALRQELLKGGTGMTREEVYSKCVERIYGDYEEGSYFAKHILPNEAIDAIIDCAVEEAVKAMEDKTE